tara:strand:+ start:516 stop:803 length:288 start_codon:yes stop_codon:yes gene_type:complete
MIVLTNQVLICLSIPILSVYIRLCLEKWHIIEKWNNSKFFILDNLANCALCYYTWSNLILTSAYGIMLMDDLAIIGFFPVFTVISLIIQFKYFED